MAKTAVPKKIVYLLGAGATHAELANLEEDPSNETFLKKTGLLTRSVSDRVIAKAHRNKKYLKNIETVSGVTGSLNIELLVSLIENSRIDGWEFKSSHLKKLVRSDIQSILTDKRRGAFQLHKALFELHRHKDVQKQEKLTGLISLNYDTVLDEAYRLLYGQDPNYCFPGSQSDETPLLKLHGSFNWEDVVIHGQRRTIDIIPLGANKSYFYVPYNFIWNRALGLLIECDVLRVIGCSLSQNDFHLIDLIFKAHLEKNRAIEIEIISTQGDKIRENYGFFTGIKTLTQIEGTLIPDQPGTINNAFKTWLKYKGEKMLGKKVARTKHLRKVAN
jgi:hypothetical protein